MAPGTGEATREPRLIQLALAFAAIYFLWGSTFLAIRFAVQTVPPLITMGIRQLSAGLLVFAWQKSRREWKPEPGLWRHALIAGAFCFLGCHGLLAWGEIRTPSGLAALLAASLPIWMVLLAPMFGQESELTLRALSGIAVGMIGVAILIPMGGARWDQISAVAILVSEVCWATGVLYSRGVRTKTPSLTFAAMQMICGGCLLWTVGLILGEGAHLTAAAFPLKSVLSLAYLITFGSIVAFTAYTWLLKHSSPAVVSTHSYVNPLVAVFLGWSLGGETVTSRTMTGAAVILAAVALLSKRFSQKRAAVATRV